MATGRIDLGKRGEDIACRFLKERNQQILERNYRKGHLEIDIITKDEKGIHFVEVKSMTGTTMEVTPQDKVDQLKQKRIATVATRYLQTSKDIELSGNEEVSFDVIAIVFDGDRTNIEYFPQAFIPLYF